MYFMTHLCLPPSSVDPTHLRRQIELFAEVSAYFVLDVTL
jgi:hypothetical protein